MPARPQATLESPTIVFDLDGTLVDSVLDLLPCLNHTIATDGLSPLTRSDIGQVVGKGAMEMIRRAYALQNRTLEAEHHKRLLGVFLAEYETHTARHTVFFDHALESLDQFAADGWKIAVCTNKYEYLARKLLDALGTTHRFHAITGGDTFDFKKPDPRHIVETVRQADGSPQRAVMVGDSINDIEAAKRAGIPVIAVDFGYTDVPVRELGPDIVLSHFRDMWPTAKKLINDS
ncbi:MAG: HAD-IA family hydrolase [Pseudomonadota bacterium]